MQTLADLLERFQKWRDKPPLSLANSATAEALDAVLELRGYVEESKRPSCQRASDGTDSAHQWRYQPHSRRENSACHFRGRPHKGFSRTLRGLHRHRTGIWLRPPVTPF
jgi:hypothetical protein